MTHPNNGLTVIIPAYNERESIGDTLISLQNQTFILDEIIVVDDCSTDDTGQVAREFGVTVLRPPRNTGSKAGAQTFALPHVKTPFVMALDADTTLAPDAIEKILAGFDEPSVAAVCGFVIPRRVRTLWERGRYVEYLLAFSFYKQVQNYYGKPLISSGCFSAYRTEPLRACGGWSNRTLAEDMDLTWSFYQQGYGVRFAPAALCYPIEPHSFRLMRKQLRRWSHGFIQNVGLHWRVVLQLPTLRWFVSIALVDATLSALFYLLLPLLALVFGAPYLLLAYIIDVPMILAPTLATAIARGEIFLTVSSVPCFLVLRMVNSFYFLEALVSEWLLRRSFRVYEKGH